MRHFRRRRSSKAASAAAPLARVSASTLDRAIAAPIRRPEPAYGPRDVLRHFFANKSTHTKAAYRDDLEAFAAWLGCSQVQAVDRLLGGGAGAANALALAWLDAMRMKGRAPATRARKLSALKSVVSAARQLGMLDWRLEIRGPRIDAYRDTLGPTTDVFHKMLASCGEGLEGLRNRAMLLCAGVMGLRRKELVALCLVHLDRERRRLLILGKGEKVSWATMPDEVFNAIESWLEAWRQTGRELTPETSVFVSLSPTTFGAPISARGVGHVIGVLGNRADARVWPHALRHAAVTSVLEESGGNVRMAQQFARHADPKTTLKYDDNRTDLVGQAARLAARKLIPR